MTNGRKSILVFLAAPAVLAMTVLAAPGAAAHEAGKEPGTVREFTIDPVHSNVGFGVRHMVVSTVRGTFRKVSGTIRLDPSDPTASSVTAEIETATIDTNNEGRDTDLKSKGFLNAEEYPKITFRSTSVNRDGDRWIARGDLTIHGVTHAVEIPFRVNGPIKDPWGNTRLGVEAEPITINRQDYGVTWSKTLDGGGLVVGNDVTITLSVEAVAKKSDPAG